MKITDSFISENGKDISIFLKWTSKEGKKFTTSRILKAIDIFEGRQK